MIVRVNSGFVVIKRVGVLLPVDPRRLPSPGVRRSAGEAERLDDTQPQDLGLKGLECFGGLVS